MLSAREGPSSQAKPAPGVTGRSDGFRKQRLSQVLADRRRHRTGESKNQNAWPDVSRDVEP